MRGVSLTEREQGGSPLIYEGERGVLTPRVKASRCLSCALALGL